MHAHHRAVAGIDAFDFARDEAIADVIETGAAILLRDRGAEQSERSHFREHGRVGRLVAKRARNPRQQFFLRVRVRRFTHHPFLLGQLIVEEKRIVPFERGLDGGAIGGIHAGDP